MKAHYDANTIESEVQNFWTTHHTFEVSEKLDKSSFYCLSMLPYPSGALHMGHVRNYTLGDVIARIKMMEDYNVLQPLGWDAFGLPAENAAIEHQTMPHEWTQSNINTMRTQLKRMGLAIDWSREFQTCSPDYYRWNQWLFLQMFKKGLVYRSESSVNWDPVDETVLANEQVVNGRGWRSGALVEQRKIHQWFFKITAYAQALLDDLQTLDEKWPKEVISMQRNWIGRATGTDVHFAVSDQHDPLIAFTTRVETIFGVSYLAIAPDHPLALKIASEDPDIQSFIECCQRTDTSERSAAQSEKKGILTPYTAHHPLSGRTLSIWVCNYVTMDYGTGCVMGVPAHDARDHAFALAHQLEIIPVIKPDQATWNFQTKPWTDDTGHLINSEQFDDLTLFEARESISNKLTQNAQGGPTTIYRLRDWGISRQRYWGTPIPIIHCASCGIVPVPESELPIQLPLELSFDQQGSPLAQCEEFVHTLCPQCQGSAQRETDTMDTFVDSSWYYARYTCPHQHQAMLDDRAKYWTPVDQYIGGIEHANMHLLYARFIHKVLRDIGLLNSDEPFQNLLTQGMVLKDGKKMSKSKGNTVTPMPLIEEYGADTVRLFSMFAAPPEQTLEWNPKGVEGAQRFLKRLWQLCYQWHTHFEPSLSDEYTQAPSCKTLVDAYSTFHTILKQCCDDINRQHFNTVVSAIMKLVNLVESFDSTQPSRETIQFMYINLSIILRALSPITPHICYTLWQALGYGEDITRAPYPRPNLKLLQKTEQTLAIQVNGKLRAQLTLASKIDRSDAIEAAMKCPNIEKHLGDQPIKKTIFIPGKLINFVV